jgi:hypothetical protein
MSLPPPPEIKPFPFMKLPLEVRSIVYQKFMSCSNIIKITFADLNVDGKLEFTRILKKKLWVLRGISKAIQMEVKSLPKKVLDEIKGKRIMGKADIVHFNARKDMILLNYFDSHRYSPVSDKTAEAFANRLAGVQIVAIIYTDYDCNEASWWKILNACADLKEVYIIWGSEKDALNLYDHVSEDREGPFIYYRDTVPIQKATSSNLSPVLDELRKQHLEEMSKLPGTHVVSVVRLFLKLL